MSRPQAGSRGPATVAAVRRFRFDGPHETPRRPLAEPVSVPRSPLPQRFDIDEPIDGRSSRDEDWLTD